MKIFKKILKPFYGSGLGSFLPLRLLLDFLLSLRNKNKPIMVGEHKMFLDHFDSLRLSLHPHEPYETEVIKKIILKGDIVLDIGAHIGYFTLIFAGLVGENGQVFAFEPHPENFVLLKKNIEANGYKNVDFGKKAVLDKNGKAKLFWASSSGDYSLIKNRGENFIETETITLDDYFKDFKNKIDFVKIDVEGVEIEALSGMRKLLEKNENLKLMIEYSPLRLKRRGIEPLEFIFLLRQYFSNIYFFDEEDKKMVLWERGLAKTSFGHFTFNLFCENTK